MKPGWLENLYLMGRPLFARAGSHWVAGRRRPRASYCQPPTPSGHPELGADRVPLEGQLGNEEGRGCLQQLWKVRAAA